ncbi:hypothetical protein V1521DRAFT_443425 [Lipomyces starkeyi]
MFVSLWSGMGVGTIVNCTEVVRAIPTSSLEHEVIRWPYPAERGPCKQYVEETSCPGWCNASCNASSHRLITLARHAGHLITLGVARPPGSRVS